MKAMTIHGFGDSDVLTFEDVAEPKLEEGYALVKVLACGINRYDLYLRMGAIRRDMALPHVLGADVIGEVAEIKGDDHGLAVGQRVMVAPGFPVDPADWGVEPSTLARSYEVTGTTKWGGYAQFMRAPTRFLLPVSEKYGPEVWAAAPLVTVTAVHAVRTLGECTEGKHVLVQAGASGSGSMCIQMARHLGAHVATTVGSSGKFDLARDCGAELLINYREESFVDQVMEWTDGAGVDLVIDPVGASVFHDNLRVLRRGGILVNFGMVGGNKAEINFANLIFGQHQIRGSMMGSTAELKEGLALVEEGALKPKLDSTYPLQAAAEAHRYVESRKVAGNVVLLPWAE